jgi:hypothetical protein
MSASSPEATTQIVTLPFQMAAALISGMFKEHRQRLADELTSEGGFLLLPSLRTKRARSSMGLGAYR